MSLLHRITIADTNCFGVVFLYLHHFYIILIVL